MKRYEYETEIKALYERAVENNNITLAFEILELGRQLDVSGMSLSRVKGEKAREGVRVAFREDSCELSLTEMDDLVGHSGTVRLLLKIKGYPRHNICATEVQGVVDEIESLIKKEKENG